MLQVADRFSRNNYDSSTLKIQRTKLHYGQLCSRNEVRQTSQNAFDRYILYFAVYIEAEEMYNIGIAHVFSCINICRVPRVLFEHEADRPSVQHHPRDPASVNAMKQTCVIVILAYFTLFQLNSH